MKKYIWMLLAVMGLLAGCQTPQKIVMTASTTVEHALQAWAVYVVDGHATWEQENKVRELQTKYYAAEEIALVALQTGDKVTIASAKDALIANQKLLLAAIELFTKGKTL